VGAPLLVLSTILGLQPGFTDAKANLPGRTGEVSLRRRPGASEAASLRDRSAV
jgi:hypothetical protein